MYSRIFLGLGDGLSIAKFDNLGAYSPAVKTNELNEFQEMVTDKIPQRK